LDTSPLSLCWHNKMLFPDNCLKSLVSQLATSCNISLRLVIWDCGDGELSPPLSLGCIPLDCQEEIPPGTNGQLDLVGESSFQRVGVSALVAHQNPVRHRNQQGEGSTAHQTGKNPGSNSGLPQEAEGELDHLPMEHPSDHHFWVKSCLSGSGSSVEVWCCVWQSGNGRRWVEIRVKTLSWSV
jgi:hypothetical protein